MDKTDSIYIIEDLVSGKRITTHIHNLRSFIYDPIRTNEQLNEQEFIVESILGHRGIVDLRLCKSNPSYPLLGMVRDVWVRVCHRDQQVV